MGKVPTQVDGSFNDGDITGQATPNPSATWPTAGTLCLTRTRTYPCSGHRANSKGRQTPSQSAHPHGSIFEMIQHLHQPPQNPHIVWEVHDGPSHTASPPVRPSSVGTACWENASGGRGASLPGDMQRKAMQWMRLQTLCQMS